LLAIDTNPFVLNRGIDTRSLSGPENSRSRVLEKRKGCGFAAVFSIVALEVPRPKNSTVMESSVPRLPSNE